MATTRSRSPAAPSSPRGGGDPPSGPAATGEGRHAHVADGSTFAPALRCLPSPVRGDVECLYRVLRTLDDLVDEEHPHASERVGAVERWARGEAAAGPEALALQELHERRPFARERLLDFCAGMRHDLAKATVQTEEELEGYCAQAGGSVGIVLANLLGTPAGDTEAGLEAEAGMATLGVAMQVTNILRDIDEDFEHGRLYIPRTLIERYGFPAPGAREQLLREQIARADALYEQGAAAIPLLREGGAAMALAATLYREILRQIEREGFGRRAGRVVVPRWRTRALIARQRAATVWHGLTE